MQCILRPLLKPVPLLGVSSGILLVSSFALSTRSASSMATSPNTWPVRPYTPRHQSWPYKESDFSRQDPSSDSSFYRAPRFVTHIDDAAIASLREYYAAVLPTSGRILDFCSSWISHYPKSVEDAIASNELQGIGMGMNQAELEANDALKHGCLLVDLNVDPDISNALTEAKLINQSDPNMLIDASTVVVSIDYLIHPVEVLTSLLAATKPGGKVHLTISNRCFPTKAVDRWLRISEEERLQMVGDYLYFAGWENIELVELSNGKDAGQPSSFLTQDFRGLMSMMGMNTRDPLWVVRATKA